MRLHQLKVEYDAEQDRLITHRLYGGDRTTRIEQEIVLGIGGVRALAALGLAPTVWHMNEGHAAFMVLERIRMLARDGVPFATALEAVAASSVFTTHTPVAAGHDHFAAEVITRYFEAYCRDVGIEAPALLDLGRDDGHDGLRGVLRCISTGVHSGRWLWSACSSGSGWRFCSRSV